MRRSRFVLGIDIPLVGSNASKNLKKEFNNDLCAFRAVVDNGRDFTTIQDVGDTINSNIHAWFRKPNNCELWDELYQIMIFEQKPSPSKKEAESSQFSGLTVVVIGTLTHFTRETIKAKLV